MTTLLKSHALALLCLLGQDHVVEGWISNIFQTNRRLYLRPFFSEESLISSLQRNQDEGCSILQPSRPTHLPLLNAAYDGLDHDHFEYPLIPQNKNNDTTTTTASEKIQLENDQRSSGSISNNQDDYMNIKTNKGTPRSNNRLKKKTRNYSKSVEPGTLGDIMSWVTEENDDNDQEGGMATATGELQATTTTTKKSTGLVTTATPSGTLANQFGIHHPLDRMALTANGNLQRLVSSYYDSPVYVLVDRCEKVQSDEAMASYAQQSDKVVMEAFPVPIANGHPAKTWDRVVHLTVYNQV